jgi:hypothetical protein
MGGQFFAAAGLALLLAWGGGRVALASGLFAGTFASPEVLPAGEGSVAASWAALDPENEETYWVMQGRIGVSERLAISGFWAAAVTNVEGDIGSGGAQLHLGNPGGVAVAAFGSYTHRGAGQLLREAEFVLLGVALEKRLGHLSLAGSFPLYVSVLQNPTAEPDRWLSDLDQVPAPLSLVASEVWATLHIDEHQALRAAALVTMPSLQYELRYGRSTLRCGLCYDMRPLAEAGLRF